MNQKSDSLAQFQDLIAGAMYDIANDGMPEDDDLYGIFSYVANGLLEMFDIQVVESKGPLKVVLTLKL